MMKQILAFLGAGCFIWALSAIIIIGFWTGVIWLVIHILKTQGVL